MTFGQLIGYNIGEKKSYIKHVGETTPNPFLKNQNWAYHWINSLKFYTVCFHCMPSWGLSEYTKIKL